MHQEVEVRFQGFIVGLKQMLQLLLNKCGTVCGWTLTALFNGSWTFFAVPNHNCDETKKKLIEIYQPQPTEMAFLTGTEENLSPERAARLVKEAKNVNVSCNLHLRVCILMKSAINGKMLLLQRPKGLIYCYDTRCMISNLDDLLVVLRPICR